MFDWILKIFHSECNARIAYLDQELDKLSKLQGELSEKAEYWNSKWPKSDITYLSRPLPNKQVTVNWDVRNFVWSNSSQLKDIITKNDLKGDNTHKTALNCLKWVLQNIKYTHDNVEQGIPEFWLFPCETLKLRKGDCEDGAILLASLMLNTGIPSYRIKLCAGYVDHQGTKTGHAYVIFLRDDDTWCVLDWCYWPSLASIESRKQHQDEENYEDIWWTCNNEYGWAQKNTIVKL